MVDVFLVKGDDGTLRAANQDSLTKIQRMQKGVVYKGSVVKPNNYKFHKKTFALLNLAYDHFCEYGTTQMEYRGRKVMPSFDRFRKDLIIMAGHYEPVFAIDGTVRLEAHSLSYDKCTDEQKERIYSDVVNAALKHVYKFQMSEQELRALVDQYVNFM